MRFFPPSVSDASSKFEQLYQKYRSIMYGVAYRILHQPEDAEDAVHMAFESAAKHINEIGHPDSPKTKSFLLIITERKALDIQKHRSKITCIEYDEATHGMEISIQEGDRLAYALAALPAQYREILLLRFDQGYGTREIGEFLGMKETAVQKRIQRARTALKKQLDREDAKNAKSIV